MAHRLLTNVFWAGIEYGPGLPAGDQIPGLSLSDEAGLVSSNRAVYTSPPPVINNGLPVLWVPNPDGGNALSIGGIAIATSSIAGAIDAAPAKKSDGVKTLTAIIRNPLTDIARANEPAEIRVKFPDGWASSPDCIRVRDSSGQYVPWQWEPCRHDRTGADISTYASGSVKAGSCWVIVPSLGAGSTVQYTVEVWPTAQGQSYVPAIVYSAPTAAIDRFTHANWVAEFAETWSWGLKKLTDPTGFDWFDAANAGVEIAYKNSNAATTQYSGLSTGTRLQTNVSHAQIDASVVGAGVVFVDYTAVSTPSTDTDITNRQQYRLFANGVVQVRCSQTATALKASTDTKLIFSNVKLRPGGSTNVVDQAKVTLRSTYNSNGARMLVLCRAMRHGSDADGSTLGDPYPGTGSYVTGATDPRVRTGTTQSNYALPSGALRQQYYIFGSVLGSDTFDAAELRFWNPLITTAAQFATEREQLQRFGILARNFLGRYDVYSSTDSNGSFQALRIGGWLADDAASGRIDRWRSVPAAITAWLSWTDRGPADASLGTRLQANYVANAGSAGWQYIGRDCDGFRTVYEEAVRRGDTAVANVVRTIIRGIADHAVLTEAQNGGTGRIVVENPNPGTPNLNATAEVIGVLLHAREIGAGLPTDDAVLGRCWTALTGAIEFRNWPPYLYSGGVNALGSINLQTLVYFHRASLAFLMGREHLPLGAIDPLYCISASTNAQGQTRDMRDGYDRSRRGSPATHMHFAVNLALHGNVSEIEQAIAIMSHVADETPLGDPSPYPIDGWNNGGTRITGDAFSAMLMMYPLRKLARI